METIFVLTKKLFFVVVIAGSLSTCKQRQTLSDPYAQAQNRYIMGTAKDYRPVGGIDVERLQASMAYRRQVAWEVVARVLEPVDLRSDVELSEWQGEGEPRVHKWVTWYDAQEFRNIVRLLAKDLKAKNQTERRACFSDRSCIDPLIDKALVANVESLNRTFWAPEYFEELLGQLRSDEDLTGLNEVTNPSGVSARGMTLYSPGVVRHYLRNIPQILNCKSSLDRLAANQPLANLSARSPCFAEEFPDDAVALKLTWTRQDGKVAHVDTSPAGLRRIFASGNWLEDAASTPILPPIPVADIGEQRILTMQSRDLGALRKRYVLTGMHIVAKEVPDWLWISLWWSPEPQKDFGADRPSDLGERFGSPWDHYKMCSVGSFVEGDKEPWKAYADNERTKDLALVLKTYHEIVGDYTWCSNHFVEVTDGHARTNCVGCHQHAGFDTDPTDFPIDFPDFDRAKRQPVFPSDYLYSFHAEPDNFVESIQTVLRRENVSL